MTMADVARDGKNGVPQETVTITSLPEARYFQICVPRTAAGYVFGFSNASKEVELYADAPFLEHPELEQYPDISELDPDWAKTAVPMASCGYVNLADDAAAATAPYAGKGGSTSLAFPYTRTAVEFKLGSPSDLGRIVIDSDKINVSRPELETGLEKASVYVSSDGRQYASGNLIPA